MSSLSFSKDLIAGGIAGSVSVIVGYPLDTVKVRLQSSSASLINGKSSVFQSRDIFRGIASPLSSITVINGLKFCSFGISSHFWDKNFTSSSTSTANKDELKKKFFCGSFAGFVKCFIICPVEHIKCRLQSHHSHKYNGSMHALSKILVSNGITGLYVGFWPTFLREVPGSGLYFSSYSYFKDCLSSLHNEKSTQRDCLISSVSGGLSGSLTWFFIYPADVIKTKLQTECLSKAKKFNMLQIGNNILKEHGIAGFYRGIGITVFRAFPVNGIIFPTYEFVMKYL